MHKISSDALEKEFDTIYRELVPLSGPAKTWIGEIFRAVARIHYRYYNDGDRFDSDYGCETAGSSATYLKLLPKYRRIIESMEYHSSGEYEKGLNALVKQAVKDFKEDHFLEKNRIDSRDYESDYVCEEEDLEDDYEEDYEEEDDEE